MPILTRRRSRDAHQEVWHVFYSDVRVGSIGQRAGVAVDVDQWGWTCGFYPAFIRATINTDQPPRSSRRAPPSKLP
jgi:hypothetical protein